MEQLDILTRIKDRISEDEYGELAALLNRNVIALGTDSSFALRDARGEIRAYKQRVVLSLKEKTLVDIKGTKAVTALGFDVLAEAAGAAVFFPPTLQIEGEVRGNPYIHRDEHHRIISVYCRAVAFRFSNKGLPLVSDWITTYDSPNYRLIDLLSKAKDKPEVFRLLPNDMQPEIDPKKNRTWASYYFDPACKLWVDTSSPEVIDWHSSIINREKKAVDYAQTFARRNAIKHLIGIQSAPKGTQDSWELAIICWRPVHGSILKWDHTRYLQMRDHVSHLSSGGSFEVGEIKTGVESAEPDAATEETDTTETIDIEPSAGLDKEAETATAPQEETAPRPSENPESPGRPGETASGVPDSSPVKVAPPEAVPGKAKKKKAEPTAVSEELAGKLGTLRGLRVAFPDLWAPALKAAGMAPVWEPDSLKEDELDKVLGALSREVDKISS